jgi:hypothetical protein
MCEDMERYLFTICEARKRICEQSSFPNGIRILSLSSLTRIPSKYSLSWKFVHLNGLSSGGKQSHDLRSWLEILAELVARAAQ